MSQMSNHYNALDHAFDHSSMTNEELMLEAEDLEEFEDQDFENLRALGLVSRPGCFLEYLDEDKGSLAS